MKKQNAINKLAFNKVAVTELNYNQLRVINGGSSWECAAAVAYTAYNVGVEVGHWISRQF
jgi:hypothetical protein